MAEEGPAPRFIDLSLLVEPGYPCSWPTWPRFRIHQDDRIGPLSAFHVDTLFIDEGFGSLDAETLDIAIDALECLHGQGRKVGIITHVAAMIDRIAVQVRVEKRGNGRSTVGVKGPASW